jgi:phosphatidylglycerol:prolipoprotein diacylglycerol transferase
VPLGLFAGRIGNFINGELWGRVTDLPWGMVFPNAGDMPRHPSMLYEALLEGVALFWLLNWFVRQPRPTMSVSGLFLLGYGVFRFAVEFVRMPDAHIGYLAFGWLTVGHLLTLPMILFGLGLLWAAYHPAQLAVREERGTE